MSIRRLFDRLRGKEASGKLLPDHVQDSPADWNAGDVAICVTGQPWICAETKAESDGPTVGAVFGVTAVTIVEGRQFLLFAEYGRLRFSACSFEKLRGDQLEACEPEFVTLLKRIKRKVAA